MTSWLHRQRLDSVLAAVRESGARSVADLGCGDGDLLLQLVQEPQVERAVGIDLSRAALDRLRERLRDAPDGVRAKVQLVEGSAIEPQPVLAEFDAAVLVETIEHIDPDRLSLLEHAVFRDMRPATVVITTPNADFNVLLGVPEHRLRRPDHRFEWGRARFRSWAEGVGQRNGYHVICRDVAGAHPQRGGASQMALFERLPEAGEEVARTYPGRLEVSRTQRGTSQR